MKQINSRTVNRLVYWRGNLEIEYAASVWQISLCELNRAKERLHKLKNRNKINEFDSNENIRFVHVWASCLDNESHSIWKNDEFDSVNEYWARGKSWHVQIHQNVLVNATASHNLSTKLIAFFAKLILICMYAIDGGGACAYCISHNLPFSFIFRYHSIHGYLSLSVCILGCIANVANVVVLTRREIRSPTNAILTGLAIADFLVMIDYIPYSWFDYILPNMNYTRKTLFSYSSAWFIMFHSIFAQICHTISIWLTVTLAVWRYIAVAYPHRNRIWCNMRTTLITITSAYIVCPFAAIPLYLAYGIQASNQILDSSGQIYKANSSGGSNISGSIASVSSSSSNNGVLQLASTSSLPAGYKNITVYKVQYSDIAKNNPTLITFNLWMYSILIKLIPCFALTILSLRLIGALLEAKRRRKQLMNSNGMQTLVNGKAVEGQPNRRNTKSLEKEKQTDRTTRMLLAVLLLFLITEFPQGILGLLSAVLGPNFYSQCYLKLGKCLCHSYHSLFFAHSLCHSLYFGFSFTHMLINSLAR